MDKQQVDTILKQLGMAIQIMVKEKDTSTWTRKTDSTWVSSAERSFEKHMRCKAERLFQGMNFIGEEGSGERDLVPGVVNLILDPVDGSALLRRGIPCWGVSLAIFDEQLQPTLGLLAYPGLDRWLLATDLDGELAPFEIVFDHGWPTLGPRQDPAHPVLISSAPYLYVSSDPHRVLELGLFHGKIRAFGCTSLHLALLTDGTDDPAAVALHRYQRWDIAAGFILCLAHGIHSAFDLRTRQLIELKALLTWPNHRIRDYPLLIGQEGWIDRISFEIGLRPGC